MAPRSPIPAIWIFVGLMLTASAIQFDRASCQRPTNGTAPPSACPPHTLLVGPTARFKTIQAAVRSIPAADAAAYTILIQPGVYAERVNVTRAGPLTLLGATAAPDDHARNRVTVRWRAATGTKQTGSGDNAFTAALTVAPTEDASLTGSGPTGHAVRAGTPFGNGDFRAYNVDFVNDFAPRSTGPSLAVSVSYANVGFYYCRIRSYQDTVYIGKLGNAYMYRSEIAGQTDFLYGFGTAWIQSSRLALRGCGGGIAAWKGTDTLFKNKYGVYVVDSEVRKANSSLSIRGKCSLGRPWNSKHRSIYIKTYLDDSIRSSGYTNWNQKDKRLSADTLMNEYKSSGPGWSPTGRREGKVSRILSDAEYAEYSTPEKVFQAPFDGKLGNTAWIDRSPAASPV